ncbi:MAG: aminopeptidase P family protein [Clostridia bacterium]|nr:aminopeptidase P family protein [Clostridia bacterium]
MKRIEAFWTVLQAIGADAAILYAPENIFYISGFTGEGTLVITRNRLCLITDSRYTLMAQEEAPDFEILPPTADLLDCLSTSFHVAYEDQYLSVAAFSRITEKLAGKELLPMGDKLTCLRQHKDLGELTLIMDAVRLADEAFAYTVTHIRSGMHEYEVAALIEGYMRREAGALPSFETICASGVRGAMPHGAASEKIIQKGELLTMDFGCKLNGYCSDITRTVSIGPASDRQKEIYNVVLYAQTRAENAVKCGMKASQLDRIAREAISNFGYGDYFGHALGHGVGIAIHEYPTISPKSDHIIENGDVFTIEPGIYIPNECGIRIEDMLYATNGGYTVLTKSPKGLLEIL